MRKKIATPIPSALASGLLEDNGRALFLTKKDERGLERVELPCVLVMAGEDPVARLTETFRAMAGIDAQVHEILFQKRHNAGTRKKKIWVPALAFKVTAKNASAKVGNGFSGYKWIAAKDFMKYKLTRMCEWLR